MRTYYCFQLGNMTYPAGAVVVCLRKPSDMRGVRTVRAASTIEAEEIYRNMWDMECQAVIEKGIVDESHR